MSQIRINTTIKGEPAKQLLELKRRGIVITNTDAVVHGIRLLYQQIVEQDLKKAQLERLTEGY